MVWIVTQPGSYAGGETPVAVFSSREKASAYLDADIWDGVFLKTRRERGYGVDSWTVDAEV